MSCHDLAKMPASCPMHKKVKSCQNHQDGEGEEQNCCKTASEYIALDQDQQLQSFEFQTIDGAALVAVRTTIFKINLPVFNNADLHYLNYKPPLIVCDFPPVLQTFLL